MYSSDEGFLNIKNLVWNLKKREDLEELASLKNEAEEVLLKDKLGKQNFHENAQK